jgi:hypothetical protein
MSIVLLLWHIYSKDCPVTRAKQAQWEGICIGLPIHHPGTRRGWVVRKTPWLLEPHEWEPVPILHLQHTLDIDPVTGFLIICLYFLTTGSILSTESIFKKNCWRMGWVIFLDSMIPQSKKLWHCEYTCYETSYIWIKWKIIKIHGTGYVLKMWQTTHKNMQLKFCTPLKLVYTCYTFCPFVSHTLSLYYRAF